MTKRFKTVVLEVVISVNDLNLLHNVNHVFISLTLVTQKLSPMRKTFPRGTCVTRPGSNNLNSNTIHRKKTFDEICQLDVETLPKSLGSRKLSIATIL